MTHLARAVWGDLTTRTPAAVLRDVLMLMKPRILLLLAITCVGAMGVASGGNFDLISLGLVFFTTLGLCLSAGGANMVNMWYDCDIDAVMQRTRGRPIPAGRLQAHTALWLGILFGVGGHVLLWVTVNHLAAWMATAGYLFYVFIYTMLLKRRTVQNIVIGGAAGAFPPVVGWAAVQGSVLDVLPWLMFAMIFFWTPPHFWALALRKNADYTRANIPMLPVVKGEAETKVQIVYYMLLLLPVTLAPALTPAVGWLYFVSAVIVGSWWLVLGVRLLYARESYQAAGKVFTFSLYHLALLFAALVLDVFI